MAYALNRLGEDYRLAGELELAKAAYEESLDICLETGEFIRVQLLKAMLGLIAYKEREYERALAYQLSVLEQRGFEATKHYTVTLVSEMAGPVAMLGNPQKAATMLGASARLISEMGIDFHPNDQAEIAEYTAVVRELLGETAFEEAWMEGQAMAYDDVVEYTIGEYR
jgi:hypothetical protein